MYHLTIGTFRDAHSMSLSQDSEDTWAQSLSVIRDESFSLKRKKFFSKFKEENKTRKEQNPKASNYPMYLLTCVCVMCVYVCGCMVYVCNVCAHVCACMDKETRGGHWNALCYSPFIPLWQAGNQQVPADLLLSPPQVTWVASAPGTTPKVLTGWRDPGRCSRSCSKNTYLLNHLLISLLPFVIMFCTWCFLRIQ